MKYEKDNIILVDRVAIVVEVYGAVCQLYLSLRSSRRLGKACCEACPIRLAASGVGLSGGCKAGLTLKE